MQIGAAARSRLRADLPLLARFLTAPWSRLFGFTLSCAMAFDQCANLNTRSLISTATKNCCSKYRGHAPAMSASTVSPRTLFTDNPTNKTGNCGEAFPRKPRAISARSVAATAGAAICTPHSRTLPLARRISSMVGQLSRKAAGRNISETARQTAQIQPTWWTLS